MLGILSVTPMVDDSMEILLVHSMERLLDHSMGCTLGLWLDLLWECSLEDALAFQWEMLRVHVMVKVMEILLDHLMVIMLVVSRERSSGQMCWDCLSVVPVAVSELVRR